MSFKALAWVLEHSEARLGARLVLIALAEYAHDDGSKAFPSVETLMQKTRLGRTAVNDALKKLRADGLIEEQGKTGKGTIVYRILMGPESGHLAAGAGRIPDSRRPDSGHNPVREPVNTSSSPQEGFSEWLAHHEQTTGEITLKPGTQAHKKIAAMFGARRSEGYSLDDLKLATEGAFADEFRRKEGHYGCESVLRPTKVAGLIGKGKRARAASAEVSKYEALED